MSRPADNSRARTKLPPYALELVLARKAGVTINLFIHAGDRAWDRARHRSPPHVLCLPPDAAFTDYAWQCVARLDITLVVWNRPPEFTDEFARLLVKSGAAMVCAIGAAAQGREVLSAQPMFYRPSRARIAA